ncbi:MAG: adenylate/guanylate cyclase domain-containing protein, partial [Candidatus Binatia bacterium]
NREKQDRAVLMQLFSRHVSPEVADTIWQQREEFMHEGRPRSRMLTATVLFTDVAGFTSISEKTDPQGLMNWLNTYLDTIAKTIMEHGGVIDDYFGDGIKANFGVPFPRTTEAEIRQDAINAVDCALAIEREVTLLNAAMQEQGRPTVKMRVGIFTGPVVAGSLGSTERLKYTTMGDAVNTASRLESFDKEVSDPEFMNRPYRILIGEQTLSFLNQQFETHRVGEAMLKGKDEKVTIYRVVGRVDRVIEEGRNELTETRGKRLVTANEADR